MRIFKTLGAVLLVCAAYGLLGGRNPCFACIGAVFGLGSFWREGVRHGGNARRRTATFRDSCSSA